MELASSRPNSKQEKLPVIQSLWISDSLGELARLSVASFLANGHPYHLYAYSDIKGVPAGAQLMDANQILPQREVYRARCRDYAPFSDWFRFELLYQKGGYWMDMDMVCLKKLDLPDAIILVKEDADHFCASILRFPKGHPFLEAFCARCRHPIKTAWRDFFVMPAGIIYLLKTPIKGQFWFFLSGKKKIRIALGAHLAGPTIITGVLNSDARWHKLRNNGLANGGGHYFYPVSYDKWFTLLDDTYKDAAGGGGGGFPDSYTVHFWNEMYSTRAEDRQSILNSASPHSVYARLKRRYLS